MLARLASKRGAGTGSLRTGLKLEDTPRTDFGGLGLGLEEAWPWLESLAWRRSVLESFLAFCRSPAFEQ